MTNSISGQINSLMTEWSTAHKERGWKCFISDGVIDDTAYECASPRICLFLKEAYSRDNDSDWNLTEWLAAGAMTRMWGTVAEWVYGITNTTPNYIPHKPQLNHAEKTEQLKTIAVVNVKKSNGAVQSDYWDLLHYAITDRTFLKRELEIISPTVIICGNNSSLLRLLYGAKLQTSGKVSAEGEIPYQFMSENGYAIVGNQIILDFYHPANQYPSILNYYTICSLYQQALKYKVGDNDVFQKEQRNTG